MQTARTAHTAADVTHAPGGATSDTDIAAESIRARCNGDHSAFCSWNAAAEIAENSAESGQVATIDEMIENGLALIDDICQCR